MILTHWNYFLAIEQDLAHLSRYIEFCSDNFQAYSIELARILMTATQEIDVLLKQICANHGSSASDEQGYRSFIPTLYPKFSTSNVVVSRAELEFQPFLKWQGDETPLWWTANNKIKHQRHTHFKQASLENMLNAVCGLLIACLYYYGDISELREIYPGPILLVAVDMVEALTPTTMGLVPLFKLP